MSETLKILLRDNFADVVAAILYIVEIPLCTGLIINAIMEMHKAKNKKGDKENGKYQQDRTKRSTDN